MAGLYTPLPTLRQPPRGGLRTDRGRCGSLLLHRNGLSPSTPCRSPGALTHVTARRIAQPPKAAFVTRLRSSRLPDRTARQLPEQSTILWAESSSTGDPRLRGAPQNRDYRSCYVLVEPVRRGTNSTRNSEGEWMTGTTYEKPQRTNPHDLTQPLNDLRMG